jgi:DNA (cytosine-5)-methyltransferase 1
VTFGSLFSGIGGLDLGLERAGMRCVWQVEIDPYARQVLQKHWPSVRRWDDVRTFPPEPVSDWTCDLLAGGFPCQPVSKIGHRRGGQDDRWLWPEFARIICILRPSYVLLENVPGLLRRGFDEVLGSLAALGFDAEWQSIQAAALGAPHRRQRIFLAAYPGGNGLEHGRKAGTEERATLGVYRPSAGVGPLSVLRELPLHDSPDACLRVPLLTRRGVVYRSVQTGPAWKDGPRVLRMAHGIPHRVDRIKGLGNAVVPQVAEWIGRRILEGNQ